MRKTIEIIVAIMAVLFFGGGVSLAADGYDAPILSSTLGFEGLHMPGGAVVPGSHNDADYTSPDSSSFRPEDPWYELPRQLSFRNTAHVPYVLKPAAYRSSGLDLGLVSLVKDLNAHRLSGTVQLGFAAITSLAIHELGHVVMASEAGADGVDVSFFRKRDGKFFLGSVTYGTMDQRSKLPFSSAGIVFSDLTFEYALASYREGPNLFNRSLLLMSVTDLLRYTVFSFYLSGGHSHHDPLSIVDETPLSKDALLAVAIGKTFANAYRMYSGSDKFVPYFNVDKYSASLNLRVVF